VVLAALTLPAVLALAGCGDTTNAAAPAIATATGSAVNSAAVHGAICAKVESAWAKFVPNAGYSVITKRLTSGREIQIYRFDNPAYVRVSTGLYGSLTGNRELQLARDVDVLAGSAGDVNNDPGQTMSPRQYLATVKGAAAVVAKDCGTTLYMPA
jgi:hypothetical protein